MAPRRLPMMVLAAVLGCHTSSLDRLPESRAAPAPAAVAAPEKAVILSCAATVPALTVTSEKPDGSDAPTTKSKAGTLTAAPSENDRQPLSLGDLEQLALRNNPTIPQAAALVQQQQGLARQAGLYPNPQAGYLRTDADQSGQSETSGVFLSQELVTAGKLRLAVQAERQDVQVRTWQLNAQQARVVNDLRVRFYEVLGAQKAVQAAGDLVGLAEQGVRTAEELLKVKQGSRPDLLQAKIQLSLVHTALQDAEFRQRGAWQHLVNVIGIPDMPRAPLAGNLEDDIPALDPKESLERLLASSPLLKAQEAEIRAAQIELRLARAQAIPNLTVQVVAQRDHVLKYSSVSTLLAMPVPLFNRNQGNIINAEGVLAQQRREYERIRLALSDQLAASLRSYASLHAQTERLKNEVLPLAKESLDLTTQGYKAGRIDFMRMLTARQSYFQANLSYIDALTELHKVLVEIEGLQLTGGLNPTEVGTALQTTPGAGTIGQRGVLLQQLQQQRTGSQNLPGSVQGAER